MVKVETLVHDFLGAQSLKVLPQGPFSDAVNQFVTKDDKHAMELFVSEHLSGQVKQMLGLESDDEDLSSAMEIYKTRFEQQLATAGAARGIRTEKKRVLLPKPSTWNSDFDGDWEDEPDAWTYEDVSPVVSAPTTQAKSSRSRFTQDQVEDMMDEDDDDDIPQAPPKRRSAPKSSGQASAAAPAKKPPARGGRKAVKPPPSEDEEEEDVVMESDFEEPPPPPKTTKRGAASRTTAKPKATTTTRAAKSGTTAKGKQTKLNFTQKSGLSQADAVELSDDQISDDDDAFEPAPAPVSTRTRRR